MTMTYKDGTEAKVGDRCLFPFNEFKSATPGGIPTGALAWREGVLYGLFPHAPYANAKIAFAQHEMGGNGQEDFRVVSLASTLATLADCLPAAARP